MNDSDAFWIRRAAGLQPRHFFGDPRPGDPRPRRGRPVLAPRDPSDPAILPALFLLCYVFSCVYVFSCDYVSGAPSAVSSDGANKARGRESRPPGGARVMVAAAAARRALSAAGPFYDARRRAATRTTGGRRADSDSNSARTRPQASSKIGSMDAHGPSVPAPDAGPMPGPAGQPLHRPVQCAPHSGPARPVWPGSAGRVPACWRSEQAGTRPPAAAPRRTGLENAAGRRVVPRCAAGGQSRLLGWDWGAAGEGLHAGECAARSLQPNSKTPSPPHLSRGAPHSPWRPPRKRPSSQRAHRASGTKRASRAGCSFGQKRDGFTPATA